jgi:hypothetical protein
MAKSIVVPTANQGRVSKYAAAVKRRCSWSDCGVLPASSSPVVRIFWRASRRSPVPPRGCGRGSSRPAPRGRARRSSPPRRGRPKGIMKSGIGAYCRQRRRFLLLEVKATTHSTGTRISPLRTNPRSGTPDVEPERRPRGGVFHSRVKPWVKAMQQGCSTGAYET